jgi:hypothetical protein
MSDEWSKQATRLRELTRDPVVRAYLLGRLLAESPASRLADLVEACLVYRERFGASGNDRSEALDPPLRPTAHYELNDLRRANEQARRTGGLPDL